MLDNLVRVVVEGRRKSQTIVHGEAKLKRDESTSEARHLDLSSLLDNAQKTTRSCC